MKDSQISGSDEDQNTTEAKGILLLKDRALDVAAEGITIADMQLPEQPLIYINEGFERLTGYTAKSMLGKNCRFLQGKDTDAETVQQIRDALNQGTECTVEILNYTKEGKPFWNRLSLTPVEGSDGTITHFIGVQSDITERKNAEEAVLEANRQLEEANRRMVRNLEAAARIQRSLLPEKEQKFEGIAFSSVVEPCDELGGDALNVVPIDGNRYAVYTVDVSGHGVRASLLSVTLSHWFSRVLEGPVGRKFPYSPVEVAEELNRQFQMNDENVQYFTMCFGIVDVGAGEFRYVTAGAPPVIAVRPDSGAEVFNIEGFPIGLVPEPAYSETVVSLSDGDRVFLFTDGVIEAENHSEEPFGTEKLAFELVERGHFGLSKMVDSVLQNVSAWEATVGHRDDCSMLAFELLK